MSDIVTYYAVVGHWSAKDIHILGLVENSTKCLGRPMVEGDFFSSILLCPQCSQWIGYVRQQSEKGNFEEITFKVLKIININLCIPIIIIIIVMTIIINIIAIIIIIIMDAKVVIRK